MSPPDECHRCDDISYDDCCDCERPTCERHGREYLNQFICFDCIENRGEQLGEDEDDS